MWMICNLTIPGCKESIPNIHNSLLFAKKLLPMSMMTLFQWLTRLWMQLGLKQYKVTNSPFLKAQIVPLSIMANGISKQIFSGVMTFVMGIVTMVRLTCNMPRKLTNDIPYSNSMRQPHQLPASIIPGTEYLSMMKLLDELEEKVVVLCSKPAVMPPEKEEMLNAALSRVDALEQELSATKKALEDVIVRQEEILAYIEKRKKRKRRFFGF